MIPSDLNKGVFRLGPYDPIKYPDWEKDYREKTRPVSPNFEVIGSIDDNDGEQVMEMTKKICLLI